MRYSEISVQDDGEEVMEDFNDGQPINEVCEWTFECL